MMIHPPLISPIRCERHAGDAYPPRCADCEREDEAAARQRETDLATERHERALERARALATDRGNFRPKLIKRDRRSW